jgi:hypothetical protein
MTTPLRDADARRILVGADMTPRALISGSFRVGFQRFRPLDPILSEFDGLVGSAQLLYRFRPTTSLGASFDQNVDYSYSDQSPYYVRRGYGLSLRRQLVERWDAEVAGSQYWHNYRHTTVLPVTDPVFNERYIAGGLTVSYQARPGTRLGVTLSYLNRQSERDDRTYDNLRIGANATYAF